MNKNDSTKGIVVNFKTRINKKVADWYNNTDIENMPIIAGAYVIEPATLNWWIQGINADIQREREYPREDQSTDMINAWVRQIDTLKNATATNEAVTSPKPRKQHERCEAVGCLYPQCW